MIVTCRTLRVWGSAVCISRISRGPGGPQVKGDVSSTRSAGNRQWLRTVLQTLGRSRMPNRLGNDDRSDEAVDRERQRDASSDNGGDGDFDSHGAGGRRSNRGFASMDRGKQKEIASKGGKAAHAKGTAHEFDSDEARNAGRKGGQAVSRNREHMAMIGRRGGEARGHSRTRTPGQQTNSQGSTGGEGTGQNSRGTLTDREVGLQGSGSGSGPANGVSTNTQGSRGTNSSLGGESRSASSAPRIEASTTSSALSR